MNDNLGLKEVLQSENSWLRQRIAELEHRGEEQREAEEQREVATGSSTDSSIYQAMFEKNLAVKLLIDPRDGAIIDANPAACEFYGYPLRVLRTLRITDMNILPPQQVAESMQQVLNEQRFCFIFQHRLASGDIRDVEVYANPMEINGRTLIYSVVHDITNHRWAEKQLQQSYGQLKQQIGQRIIELNRLNEALQAEIVERKQAEEALRKSEQTLEAILNASPDLISGIDMDGNILWVSPAARDMLGMQEQITDSKHWIEQIHPDDQQKVLNHFGNLLLGHSQLEQFRYRFRHADNRWVVLETHSRLMTNAAGEPSGIVSVSRDVTEQVRMENDLRQTQAATELAMQHKDSFLAGMSHELRTPLNAILGLSESLQEEVYGPLSDKQRISLQMIEESGKHLLALISDILDIAKIEAGRMILNMGCVIVEDVCQASLRLIRQSAYKKQIQIVEHIIQPGLTFQADERRLKQLLVNLLSNAVKFTPEGGQIGLTVSSNQELEQIVFTVWDTGIGIAQDVIEHLFQPFVQIDSSLSRKHTGTGLGLTLVAQLTDLHGGSVTVESAVNVGSSFIITLPWHMQEAQHSNDQIFVDCAGRALLPAHPLANPTEKPATILLADDNESATSLLADYLTARGYQIITHHDGSEALAWLKKERPSLILMDIQMPKMDGLQAIRSIRSNANLSHIPIIALTALAMPGDRERCLQAGATSYLSKPISLRRLLEVIERCLDSAASPQHRNAEA